jgi:hypothetical protein
MNASMSFKGKMPRVGPDCRNDSVWSYVVRAQGLDRRSGSLMDLSFSLEVLRKSAAPRLYRRPLRLRLMPGSHGSKSGIPPPLEIRGDLGDRIGH